MHGTGSCGGGGGVSDARMQVAAECSPVKAVRLVRVLQVGQAWLLSNPVRGRRHATGWQGGCSKSDASFGMVAAEACIAFAVAQGPCALKSYGSWPSCQFAVCSGVVMLGPVNMGVVCW